MTKSILVCRAEPRVVAACDAIGRHFLLISSLWVCQYRELVVVLTQHEGQSYPRLGARQSNSSTWEVLTRKEVVQWNVTVQRKKVAPPESAAGGLSLLAAACSNESILISLRVLGPIRQSNRAFSFLNTNRRTAFLHISRDGISHFYTVFWKLATKCKIAQ